MSKMEQIAELSMMEELDAGTHMIWTDEKLALALETIDVRIAEVANQPASKMVTRMMLNDSRDMLIAEIERRANPARSAS